MYVTDGVAIDVFKGCVISEITVDGRKEEVVFVTSRGTIKMHHCQDCCESVGLEEIVGGELTDLIGHEILDFQIETNSDDLSMDKYGYNESHTWTFYTFKTMYHTIVMRWLGTSNGYYSEAVDFDLLKDKR